MKKIICLSIVIFTFFSVFNLTAQWVEKNGMLELSSKIPDIQNLKIFPNDNLIITVSKDNTIRFIAYDTGIITKIVKPDSITDNNDFAEISSDGKTTILGYHLIPYYYNIERELKIYIIDNNNGNIIVEHRFNYEKIIDNSSIFRYLTSLNFHFVFFDFDYFKKSLFICINYQLSYSSYGGKYDNACEYSYLANGIINNKQFEIKNESRQVNINNMIFENLKENNSFLAIMSSWAEKFDGIEGTGSKYYSGLLKFSKNLDSFVTFFSYDNYSQQQYNYFIDFKLIFNSIYDNQYLLTATDILYNYDIVQMKFVDSVRNTIFTNYIDITNKGHFIHSIQQKYYSIYTYPNFKEIYKYELAKNLKIQKPFIDDKLGGVIFCFADSTIGMLNPEPIKPINNVGFIISKDTVYIGEPFKTYALTIIDSCKYEWQFIPGIINNQNSKDASYQYDKPGQYDIKLTITTPDGKSYIYEKQKVITVLQTLKADFDVSILNSDLPVKVQFTNKSIGASLKFKWNFGDGTSDTTENPIHEYKFRGDFSPSINISDGISNDLIKKYEAVIIEAQSPEYQKADSTYFYKSGKSFFKKAYSTGFGFCIINEEKVVSSIDYGNGTYYYKVYVYYDLYNFNKDFKLINQNRLSTANQEGVRNIPSGTCMETMFSNDNILLFFAEVSGTKSVVYDIINKKQAANTTNMFGVGFYIKNIFNSSNNTFFNIYSDDQNSSVIKVDCNLNKLWELPLKEILNCSQYLADTLDGGLDLLARRPDKSYKYFSISKERTFKSENYFNIDSSITIKDIKSIDNNLTLIYGYKNDYVNKTSYGFYSKYNQSENTIDSTNLYSRTDIRKLVRINNKYYAAIGTSRGTQGYLILDTNLNQIKDIRIPGLINNLKDIIVRDNKVYLFTESIISLPIEALGVNDSYETDITVLSLPADIIADVDENYTIKNNEYDFSIFPNPATDYIEIQPSEGWQPSEGSVIQIFDMLGVNVLSVEQTSSSVQKIDISNLSPSIYFIKIGNRVEKFVKI